MDLMIVDTQAYGQVSSAYSMPRTTQEERIKEHPLYKKLQNLQPKYHSKLHCAVIKILKLNEPLVDKGNPNLISDVGVAILIAESALRSAVLNVEINLSYIKDNDFCTEIRNKLKPIIAESSELRKKVYEKVKIAIKAEL